MSCPRLLRQPLGYGGITIIAITYMNILLLMIILMIMIMIVITYIYIYIVFL